MLTVLSAPSELPMELGSHLEDDKVPTSGSSLVVTWIWDSLERDGKTFLLRFLFG